MSKPKNRRETRKYPALDPSVNLKTRIDLIDYDYIEQLSDEEKDWLNRFTEEYVNASFKHKTRVQKKKSEEKEAYSRNNARNRCILTRGKAKGIDYNMEKLNKQTSIYDEDIVNAFLDLKEEFSKKAIDLETFQEQYIEIKNDYNLNDGQMQILIDLLESVGNKELNSANNNSGTTKTDDK